MVRAVCLSYGMDIGDWFKGKRRQTFQPLRCRSICLIHIMIDSDGGNHGSIWYTDFHYTIQFGRFSCRVCNWLALISLTYLFWSGFWPYFSNCECMFVYLCVYKCVCVWVCVQVCEREGRGREIWFDSIWPFYLQTG